MGTSNHINYSNSISASDHSSMHAQKVNASFWGKSRYSISLLKNDLLTKLRQMRRMLTNKHGQVKRLFRKNIEPRLSTQTVKPHLLGFTETKFEYSEKEKIQRDLLSKITFITLIKEKGLKGSLIEFAEDKAYALKFADATLEELDAELLRLEQQEKLLS